jgi:hypothetical protein
MRLDSGRAGEPSGGAFEFARESVSAPGVMSAENARALSFWSNGTQAGARVLGRTGPLTSRITLDSTTTPGVVAADPSRARYMRVWVEATADPCCFYGVFTYRLYSQALDRNGAAIGMRSLVSLRASTERWDRWP